MQGSMADGGGSHDKRAISNCFGDGLELFGTLKQRGGTNSGTRLPKRGLIRVHDPQVTKSEIAHCACSRADIERIPRRHKDDAEAIELSWSRQRGAYSKAGTRYIVQG
jgi:hypothetical protein